MTTLLRLCTLVAFVSASAGCAVVLPVHHKHGKSSSALRSSRPDCHPSQYWDGHQCRHKGKGHGARKHDH